MKKESTIMRTCLSIICLWFMVACVNQQTKIRDEEHKTFNVNGVSALDGYEAVSNSLKNIGFTIDKDGVAECDLTYVGKGFTYYVNYYAERLTNEQSSKLRAGCLTIYLQDLLLMGMENGEYISHGTSLAKLINV